MNAAGVADIGRWLSLEAPPDASFEEMLEQLGAKLIAAGLPLWRASISYRTLNPECLGLHLAWERGAKSQLTRRPYSILSSPAYLGTPAQEILEGRQDEVRVRLELEAERGRYAILDELAAKGATDYLIFALKTPRVLRPERSAIGAIWMRQWISFSTDVKGGFAQSDIVELRTLLPLLGMWVALEVSKDAHRALLRAYLGPNASHRVLTGDFQRGSGEAIPAALWYCDMRGFTSFSDSRPAQEVVRALDEYFDCVATPVEDEGGEVLKFVGDAVLGIFPLSGGQTREPCQRALRAAKTALSNIGALNQARRTRSEPALGLGIALHVGEVMYGNVGARSRLDFTAIGAPVNVVCRVEALTRTLGVDLLATRDFVRAGEVQEAKPLGEQRLKGVSESMEVFGV